MLKRILIKNLKYFSLLLTYKNSRLYKNRGFQGILKPRFNDVNISIFNLIQERFILLKKLLHLGNFFLDLNIFLRFVNQILNFLIYVLSIIIFIYLLIKFSEYLESIFIIYCGEDSTNNNGILKGIFYSFISGCKSLLYYTIKKPIIKSKSIIIRFKNYIFNNIFSSSKNMEQNSKEKEEEFENLRIELKKAEEANKKLIEDLRVQTEYKALEIKLKETEELKDNILSKYEEEMENLRIELKKTKEINNSREKKLVEENENLIREKEMFSQERIRFSHYQQKTSKEIYENKRKLELLENNLRSLYLSKLKNYLIVPLWKRFYNDRMIESAIIELNLVRANYNHIISGGKNTYPLPHNEINLELLKEMLPLNEYNKYIDNLKFEHNFKEMFRVAEKSFEDNYKTEFESLKKDGIDLKSELLLFENWRLDIKNRHELDDKLISDKYSEYLLKTFKINDIIKDPSLKKSAFSNEFKELQTKIRKIKYKSMKELTENKLK